MPQQLMELFHRQAATFFEAFACIGDANQAIAERAGFDH